MTYLLNLADSQIVHFRRTLAHAVALAGIGFAGVCVCIAKFIAPDYDR